MERSDRVFSHRDRGAVAGCHLADWRTACAVAAVSLGTGDGSLSVLLLDLVDRLFENPAITLPEAARHLKVTHRAAKLNVDKLVRAGILTEITGRIRHKLYVALGILERLEASRAVS